MGLPACLLVSLQPYPYTNAPDLTLDVPSHSLQQTVQADGEQQHSKSPRLALMVVIVASHGMHTIMLSLKVCGLLQVEYYSWKLENRYQRNLAYKVMIATAPTGLQIASSSMSQLDQQGKLHKCALHHQQLQATQALQVKLVACRVTVLLPTVYFSRVCACRALPCAMMQ